MAASAGSSSVLPNGNRGIALTGGELRLASERGECGVDTVYCSDLGLRLLEILSAWMFHADW